MSCNHKEWVYPPPYQCDYTGEMIEAEPYERSICEDLDTGRFKCRSCGEIGYYTGLWKRFYEEGVPCAGSDRIKRA